MSFFHRPVPPPGEEPREPIDSPPPPLVLAARLWLFLGWALLVLAVLPFFTDVYQTYLSATTLSAVLFLSAVGMIALGPAARSGVRTSRPMLVALTVPSAIVFWPLLVAVPAIALQYHEESNAWYEIVNRPRGGAPGSDGPGGTNGP